MAEPELVALERIERAIVVLRGHKVLLDGDLATLYGVEVKALNQAVKRNLERFPADFMFRLTPEETRRLRSQSVTLDLQDVETAMVSSAGGRRPGRGRYVKYQAYAFTEQGVAMLSTVLRSPRAVQVNIEIMRAFVLLRRILQGDVDLARKVAELEQKYDGQFRAVFDAIRELMTPVESPQSPIGFRP